MFSCVCDIVPVLANNRPCNMLISQMVLLLLYSWPVNGLPLGVYYQGSCRCVCVLVEKIRAGKSHHLGDVKQIGDKRSHKHQSHSHLVIDANNSECLCANLPHCIYSLSCANIISTQMHETFSWLGLPGLKKALLVK